MRYKLDLQDKASLERIKKLITYYYDIMQLLNEDSNESADGGASVHYTVDIDFKEEWI